MSAAGTNAVKIGVWTDYSKPRPLGATLTLTNRNAALLLAFLATLVGITATRSWRLGRFLLFNLFAYEKRSVEQRPSAMQVLLSNSETAAGAGVNIASLFWEPKYKGSTRRTDSTWRRAVIILASFGHWILFIAAGLLTSQIFLGRTVISSVTPTCGVWVGKNESTQSVNYGIDIELSLNSTLEAEDYVRNCYTAQSSSTTILDCGKLHTRVIPFADENNATCPFPTGICLYNNQSAYGLDTGRLPFTTLGLNCPRCDEMSFRRRSVCAPLRDGQLFVGTAGDDAPEGEGTLWVWSFFKNETGGDNETFSLELNWNKSGFKLRSMNLGVMDTTRLQPPLQHNDGGSHNPVLILVSVNLGTQFMHKVADPIFSIQGDIEPERFLFPDWPWKYRSNQMLGVIGCDEQVQYCNERTGKCTALKGVVGVLAGDELTNDFSVLAGNETADDDAYEEVLPAAVLVDNLLLQSTMAGSISDRDGNIALQAARSLQNDRVSAPLGNEHWKVEVNQWFALGMARLQLGVFSTIERRPGIDPERVQNLWDNVQKFMCGSIKYTSAGHTSMSFFGIMLVVVVCGLLLVGSFFEVVLGKVLVRLLGDRMGVWERANNLKLLEGGDEAGGNGPGRVFIQPK